MSDVATVEHVSAETLEHVLGTGDLSKLTPAQRVEYMSRTCKTLGLNPLTRPFRFMVLNGQTQLYATRDCADQLRQLHKISVQIVDKTLDGELYVVTARARTADGRTDEDMGVVAIGKLQGDFRANGILKAITKAKRRVTLSICGLGFLDETEVETLVPQGAKTFDAEEELPKVDVPQEQKRRSVRGWLDDFHRDCALANTRDEAEKILQREEVVNFREVFRAYPAVVESIDKAKQEMIDRHWEKISGDE